MSEVVLTTEFWGLGLLVFRAVVGWIFMRHALPKLNDPEGTREFFQSLDLPDSLNLVYAVTALEIIGGTLLMVGLYAQTTALVLTWFMGITTYISVQKMDKEFEGGYEVDLLLMVSAFMLYLNGAGPFSLDAMIAG